MRLRFFEGQVLLDRAIRLIAEVHANNLVHQVILGSDSPLDSSDEEPSNDHSYKLARKALIHAVFSLALLISFTCSSA